MSLPDFIESDVVPGLLANYVKKQTRLEDLIRVILGRKAVFGITRLGSVTRLDRVGIPVAQAIRPRSQSVVVSQGKGLTYAEAGISALMESLEGWAGERTAVHLKVSRQALSSLDDAVWSDLTVKLPTDEIGTMISCVAGWDVISKRSISVPMALVDTNYIVPSPHPSFFIRNTTGLAAHSDFQEAVSHACLELLERDACHNAYRKPHFFDRNKISDASIKSGKAAEILKKIKSAGYVAGIWTVPAAHELPIFWCQVMESSAEHLAPLPASGFGCDISADAALAKALLEACQSRLGVISAAREDVHQTFYEFPESHHQLDDWRLYLASGGLDVSLGNGLAVSNESKLFLIFEALRNSGAKAVIIVLLYCDRTIPLFIVRVIAPALETFIEEY